MKLVKTIKKIYSLFSWLKKINYNENIFGDDKELYAPQAGWHPTGNTQNPPIILLNMLNLYTGKDNPNFIKF